MSINWVSLLGEFEQTEGVLTFKGGLVPQTAAGIPRETFQIGNFLSDVQFGEGSISADIEFLESTEDQGCEFILYHNPEAGAFLTAGLGSFSLCVIRGFATAGTGASTVYAQNGPRGQLKPGESYHLKVLVRGSRTQVILNDVAILSHALPFVVPRGNAGIWCVGAHDIRISNFDVSTGLPSAFIVTEFSSPYDEIYTSVIRPVCEKCGLKPHRADETPGPGLIIADIERRIAEARLVIADISPPNRNVYYELGFAHARNKPTILVAEQGTDPPFDISPFRTLFYENTIDGKSRLEEGLRSHIEAIQTEWVNV